MWKFEKNLEENCEMSFIQPCATSEGDLYAKIDKFEIEANIHRWDNTFVGYVLGDKLYYTHLKVLCH